MFLQQMHQGKLLKMWKEMAAKEDFLLTLITPSFG
jgi:hypothetical protein